MTPQRPDEFPAIPAIVLAAGRSLRMGRPKGLLPHPASGLTLVAHVTNVLRDGGASPVAVVTGAHHAALAPIVEAAGAACLFNARHDAGQLASLQRAIAWARGVAAASWALVTLVDLPGISAETVRDLIAASRHTPARAVRPLHAGRHGHPVLWHASTWPLLDDADEEMGARQVIRELAARGEVLDVPVADPGVLRDLDTPEDYDDFVRERQS